MKKLILTLLITAVALPSMAAPKFDSLMPDSARHSVREVIQTVVRHFLNFRKETPLSAEQREKVGAVLEAHRAEARSIFTRSRDARRAFVEAAKTHGADAPATRAAADKTGEVTRDRALLIAKVLGEVRLVLTEAQMKRLESAHQEVEDLVDQAFARAAQ